MAKKYAHRQPIATWSGVVLLSALLLSPVTAASFLRALAEIGVPQTHANTPINSGNPAPENPRTASVTAPRRAAEEETRALRAAALAGQFRAVRLDSDPENPYALVTGGVDYAIFLPSRVVLRIPDDPMLADAPMHDRKPAERDALRHRTPPRAPPV